MLHTQHDNQITQLWLGKIIPAILFAIVITNIATGTAVLPNVSKGDPGTFFYIFTSGRIYWGILITKVASATALFAWHYLANQKKYENPATLITYIASATILLGLTLIISAAKFFTG